MHNVVNITSISFPTKSVVCVLCTCGPESSLKAEKKRPVEKRTS